MNIDKKFNKITYICIHGNVKNEKNKTKCKDEHFFMKVSKEQVSSDRQFMNEFDTLSDMIAAFPEKEIPDELINTLENIKKEV
jgi:hypothetical protein